MKIMSLNVRGLGDQAKRRRLRSLISSGKFDCVLLQETKCSVINDRLVENIWGNSDCEWIAQMSVGLAGGILSIWNLGMLNFQFSFSGCGFVGICFN